MKKILAIALTAVLALALVACSSGPKDGAYTAEYKNLSHGWKEYLTVTYKDGAVTDVDFDAKNEAGALKTETADYGMDPAPSVWMPQIEESIKTKGEVEAVAGATHSSDSAKELLAAVNELVKAGKPGTTVVENAAQ